MPPVPLCSPHAVLFSAAVIQWVTSRDSTSQTDSFSASHGGLSHAGDELGHMRSQHTRQRTSQNGNKGADLASTCGSAGSRCSRKILSSTEAIVDDAAKIFIDDSHAGGGGHSPISTGGPFADDKKIITTTTSTTSPSPDDDDDDKRNANSEKDMIALPRPPPPSRAPTGGRHVPSTSEVLVHVDYGASLSHETTMEGVRLGNSIVIGVGGANTNNNGSAGGGAGARRSHWGIGEGGVL